MEEFLKSILGDYSVPMWFAYSFFALLGTAAFSWIEVKNRDKASVKTPVKFRWKFFVFDNLRRYIATGILIYIQFRFFKELSGSNLSEYVAFLIGFGSDGIAGTSKRTSKLLQADRDRLLRDNQDNP
ncbi:MAG: hypothetical protein WCT13_06180 [Patescibacteria group bacterium]